ncbi:hypothetical protein KKB40_04350 [Patescibacteria group bacterium]|nr:hypothetical protein [Patescibacteria group bacterium]
MDEEREAYKRMYEAEEPETLKRWIVAVQSQLTEAKENLETPPSRLEDLLISIAVMKEFLEQKTNPELNK